MRPHRVGFLVWCRQREHRLAIWTAGDWSWPDRVVRKLCPLVQQELAAGKTMDDGRGAAAAEHVCPGRQCGATFDFTWAKDKMRHLKCLTYNELTERKRKILDGTGRNNCHWCEFYSDNCKICQCFGGPNDCPCRAVKDLRGIWWNREEETANFVKERTLVIENTPQHCRYNYGNAIYVPTFRGGVNDEVFLALHNYIESHLEKDETDVRCISKCEHARGPHACYRQLWWPT